MNVSRMDSLTDMFKCFICLGKVKDARLCPQCSKPCCYACILRWLETAQRSQCPHCRVALRVKDLINCRWIGDVTQQLDAFLQIKGNEEKELCISHNEKLSVFCVDCKQCICHQCALWGDSHNKHVFKPLEEMCLQQVKKVEEELSHLRRRQCEIINVLSGVDESISNLTNAKNKRVDEVKSFMALTVSQLERQLKEKVAALYLKKLPWLEECEEIGEILESSKKLKTFSKNESLLRSRNIIQRISKLMSQPITNHQNLCVTVDNDFPSEIIPHYDYSTFNISNFASLQLIGVPIYSPPLQVYGLTWRIKVYPGGRKHETVKYLSIHFELSSEFHEVLKYQYKAEMIHCSKDPSRTVVREFTSYFAAGERWGFNHFYIIDMLSSEGYLNDDTLCLKFSVRPASYCQKSKIQEWYLSQLQNNMLTETLTDADSL